jgi:hypothetical protein
MRVIEANSTLSSLGLTPEEYARIEFVNSWKRLINETNYLANARPSDWEFRATQTNRIAANEIPFVQKYVVGKTGNPDAEKVLLDQWHLLANKSAEMLQNPPSIIAQIKDKVALFLTDFWQGVRDAQRSSMEWLAKNAGNTLRMYHEAANRIILRESELAKLKREGLISAEEAKIQEEKISRAKQLLDKIRALYRTLSGGESIDELAQKEFGRYQTLGLLLEIAAVLALAAISGLVIIAWKTAADVQSILPHAKRAAQDIESAAKAAVQLPEKAGSLFETMEIALMVGIGAAILIAVIYLRKATARS